MIWSALQISLVVVACSTFTVGILGLGIAYILARYEFFGKELLDALLTMPLVLPPTVTGFFLLVLLGKRGILGAPLYDLTGFSFVFTWQGAAIAAVIVSLPLMIKASRAGIESVEQEYELASYTLGKSKFETFLRITLPLARKGVLAGLILSFARAFGEFGATLMIAGNIPERTQTLPLAIYEAVSIGNDKAAFVIALILTSISVAAVYLTNKLNRSYLFG
ncbi:MAG: molybdate ABC transporter permease subunit [Pyrinomonadaceae bacterium]